MAPNFHDVGSFSVYCSDPSKWENSLHFGKGSSLADSDICRCNARVWGNLQPSSDHKFSREITKLGIVMFEHSTCQSKEGRQENQFVH